MLAAGEEFTCGITTDDVAYCWGSNTAGLLGDGSDAGTTEPVRVKRP
jgi:alpha-tubulin suppressor-like RCC1 family protein